VAEDARAALARTGHPRVDVRAGDGWDGVRERAPFDAIEVTAGTDDISPSWAEQLRDGGLIVLPLWLRAGIQISVAFRKQDRRFRSGRVIPCGFMRLQGGNKPVSATVKVRSTVALFDAPEFSTAVESLLRIAPTTERATEAPPGWFERAALDESDLLPISMFEEGSWNDRRGFFDPEVGSIAVVAGTEISVYGSPLAAATLRERMERAQPLDLSALEIVAVPTPEGSRPQASWRIVRPCFTFLLRER
jgi:protein-L-isoaspartate(D-aspartate) O-methyltransferase